MAPKSNDSLDQVQRDSRGGKSLSDVLLREQTEDPQKLYQKGRRGRAAQQEELGEESSLFGKAGSGISIEDYATMMTKYALELDELNEHHKDLSNKWSGALERIKSRGILWGVYKSMHTGVLSHVPKLKAVGGAQILKRTQGNSRVLDSIIEQTVENFIGAGKRVKGSLKQLQGLQQDGLDHLTYLQDESVTWREEATKLDQNVREGDNKLADLSAAYQKLVEQQLAMPETSDEETKAKEEFGRTVTQRQGELTRMEIEVQELRDQRARANKHVDQAENSMRAQEATLATVKSLVASYQMMDVGYETQIEDSMPIFQQNGKIAASALTATRLIEFYNKTMKAANDIISMNVLATRSIALESMEMLAQPFFDEEKLEQVKAYAKQSLEMQRRFSNAYHKMSQGIYIDPSFVDADLAGQAGPEKRIDQIIKELQKKDAEDLTRSQ